jgi:tripeptide aminopeptidase
LYKNTIMFQDYGFTVAERFMQYVQIDTQSDPQSTTFPSTAKQKKLAKVLVAELLNMGIVDAEVDDHGYVYATIPANTEKKIPVICFCSHLDTAPDCSGTDVKPLLHKNYNGGNIVLPNDTTQVLSTINHPYLAEKIGEDIITASGTTLLGADDKAGVAIIIDFVHYLQHHPDIEHGTIKILFTPDEEIGKGVDKVDMSKLATDIGYTLDGSERGSYEDENFSADKCTIVFQGVSAHPGTAKGKLVNALKVAAAFIAALPENLSPEVTADKQGFIHPIHLEGMAEKASVELLLRSFDTLQLEVYKNILQDQLTTTLRAFAGATAVLTTEAQYRNMKEVIDAFPLIEQHATEAMKRAGVTFHKKSIRGGTDGARLSFMGLPCPNIFTGEMAVHSKQEFVSVQDMQKSVETLVHLVMIWAERS